ncbi:MAG: hypothetical protein QNJ98_05335 [Planctomycetota bacterium]|nr:hypothetical protein [Planctomycetota bacterium]
MPRQRTQSIGDLTLTARPATPETFAPYGTLIGVGGSAQMGKGARVLVSLIAAQTGPRRATHLVRYPEARRGVVAPEHAPMWVVVLVDGAADEAPTPEAFLIQPGMAIVLEPGVWHAGPSVVADGTLTELLEVRGGIDRLDRQLVSDLVPSRALRVVLPEEPEADI